VLGLERWELCYYFTLIASIIVHEIAHGVVAFWNGDDTAKLAGRLTLNPLPHIDPLGSVILPALAVFSGLPAFGWAKPVPVNPVKLRNRRRDMLLVGLAGPGTNLLLMAVFAVVARVALDGQNPFDDAAPLLGVILFFAASANLFLAVFNLLPIPPLDGASLLERVVPARHLGVYYRVAPYGMLIIFGLVFFTDIFGDLVQPLWTRLAEFIVG
jgi:Zn-dependent protease